MDKVKIGRKIKLIRHQLGLSQEEFGKLIDCADKSLVSKWERALSMPNNARLKIIAELGNMDVTKLIDEDANQANALNSDDILQEFDQAFERYTSLQKMEHKDQYNLLESWIDRNELKDEFLQSIQQDLSNHNTLDRNNAKNMAAAFIDRKFSQLRQNIPNKDEAVLRMVTKEISNLTEKLKTIYFIENGNPNDLPNLNIEMYKKVDYILKNTLYSLINIDEE